jgi:hypothetical protein
MIGEKTGPEGRARSSGRVGFRATRRSRPRMIARAAVVFLLLAATAAADGWVIFKGQVNGPVKAPGGVNPAAFALKHYPGLFWTEAYYHHMNFPDGSMVTVSIGLDRNEVNVAFVYGKTGIKPYKDFIIADVDDLKLDAKGFGFSIGANRIRLAGNKYTLDLALPKTRAKIEYDIIGPSYNYGDNLVRYPDGDTFMFYNLPISWARVKVTMVLDGREVKLEGSGDMNHDAGVIFPGYVPLRWRVFWFFGPDHTLAMTENNSSPKFGSRLSQRLVFVDQAGHMFTSTSYQLKWEDWEQARGIPFRYPRKYTLVAEGQGAQLKLVVSVKEKLLMEDLYSNLPVALRLVVERLIDNAWTMDHWSQYTLTYSHDGQTETFQGRGITRWTSQEEK